MTRRTCAAALGGMAGLWGLNLAACALPAGQSAPPGTAAGSPVTISVYSRTSEQEAVLDLPRATGS